MYPYKSIICILSFLFLFNCLKAIPGYGDHEVVKEKIDSFFIAMTNADSLWMNSNLMPETILTTVKGADSKNMSITKQEFIQSLIKSKDAKVKIDERLLNYSIRVDQN